MAKSFTFRDLVHRSLPFLWERAGDIIERLETDGILPRSRRSVAGVVDESLLLAWERSRGDLQDVDDNWLSGIVREVIEAAVFHVGETTPEIAPCTLSGDQLDTDTGSRQYQQCLGLGDRDPKFWEDTFPARRETERLKFATLDEERDAMLSSLKNLGASDRDAFSLYAFDNFESREIASLQKRELPQVEKAIDVARRELMEDFNS